jgi:hypothetical protein
VIIGGDQIELIHQLIDDQIANRLWSVDYLRRLHELRDYIDQRLTPDKDDAHFVKGAKEYHWLIDDDDLDLDVNPIISENDDGAYVCGWLWVPRPEKDSA